MITEIMPIWVVYYARDIIKLDSVNKLNSYNEKYHLYDHEFGSDIIDEKQRRRKGILYATIIAIVFFFTHFIAAKYTEEAAGFYPPYIEKSIIYPELFKK